jgi:dihydrofolate synthase/folylpolyglutamate synthase
MAEALAAAGWPLGPAEIRTGLAAARWPGRLELRSWAGRPLLLDGAHNPPAAAALRRELEAMAPAGEHPMARRWLIGIQRHKEGAVMLDHLLRPGDRAAIVPVPGHASWSAAELAEALPGRASQLHPTATPQEGLDWLTATDLLAPLPVVTGSLHLLGAMLPLLGAE